MELADFTAAKVDAELEPDGVVFSFIGIIVGILETDVGEKFLVFKFAGEGDGEAIARWGGEGVFDLSPIDFRACGTALEVFVAKVGDPLICKAVSGESHHFILGGRATVDGIFGMGPLNIAVKVFGPD